MSRNRCRRSNASAPSISAQRLRALGADAAAPARHCGHRLGEILDGDHVEAGRLQQPLVLAGRGEVEVADRAADRELVARHEPRDRHRVGDEHATARSEQPRPVGEHAGPAGQVIERVQAEDRVEGAVGERQRLARVGLDEAHGRLEPGLARDPARVREPGLLAVDARQLAARLARELQPGTAGAARDVQQADARPEPQLRCKAGELGPRLPVVLAEVLAELLAPDLRVDLVAEVAVERPVVGAGLDSLAAHRRARGYGLAAAGSMGSWSPPEQSTRSAVPR